MVTFLRNAYPSSFREKHPCDFRLFSSGELAQLEESNLSTTVSLYLFRITMNEHLRNKVPPSRAQPPLMLDLHYLLTVWTDSPLAEHSIAAWVMRELYQQPVMDISLLSPDADWGKDDVVQIIPAELSNEDMMRIWDALAPNYRLSLSYMARVVRIDADESESGLPVVATRFQFEGKAGHVD